MTRARRRPGRWARKPGDPLEIGGPRGSTMVADDFDFYLLHGRRIRPARDRTAHRNPRPGVPVTSLVAVDGPEHAQTLATRADWTPIWVFREGEHACDATLLRGALAHWQAPPGDGYVWIAGEARTARILRDVMIGERGHPKGG